MWATHMRKSRPC
ncbi:hypothetical protein F383_39080 [Gossypium arboreum]|uniref:Uncharacterized protein n=1 Tax=Gossypium arboreum TaxID=29729 RepID=A0A0B0MPA3_GOSAR|nr:hypothetical protein F383_39080 [Gossypium arboreum]